MRNWLSEVRIGLIAGVSAGVVILAAPHVARVAQLGLARSSVASDRWTPQFSYDAFLTAASRPRLL